ncbi:MAG: tetratricopeptide repeat protein [Deltaproteobacteria bacterium]|nr:tetratricopeptide repeat protein [Deltaproteobacteria bacterium]
MDKIIPFPAQKTSKFGFERVKKLREIPARLNRFPPGPGRILRLPTHLSSFEEALLLDEREDRRAADSYRRAISEDDCMADAYCNLGIIESKAGRMAKAFDCFTKSLEQDPRHFESHYNLGNLYFEEDNLRLARMHYELAAEINPASPNLYFNLGLVLALLDEKKAAVNAFLNYQRLAPREERKNADDLITGLKRSLTRPGRGFKV